MVFLKSVLIEGALRPVDEVTAAYLRVKPGQKICPSCAKRSNINEGNAVETQETVVSFDVADEKPPEAAIEEINKAAELLNCSPLKTSVGVRDRSYYGKRKVREISKAAKAQCSKALDVEISDSDLDDAENECKKM